MASIIKIRNELENIILFLEPMLPLANSHMIDYFSKSSFKNNLPPEIKSDVLNNPCEEVINNILHDQVTACKTPHLYNYIRQTKSLHLSNLKDICLSRDELYLKLKNWGCSEYTGLKLQVYITPKKSHEVEILSKVVTAINCHMRMTHLMDIGDGKGYLSSILALYYKIPVLGIDCSETKTESAVERVKRLKKIWKGIDECPKKSLRSDNDYEVDNNLYKQTTQFVTEHTDLNSLMNNAFSETIDSFGLVGLHTCGNLGATSAKVFSKNLSIKTLCNVSCCYNLLNEEFCEPLEVDYGFPLSNYLRERKYKLGQIARMLASQSVDRILYKKEIPKRTIFYRALLEVLLVKYNCNIKYKQIGKFNKDFDNFRDYAQCALRNIVPVCTVSNEELANLYDMFKDSQNQLYLFYLLRILLAPVIESLILLDRLLFLHEKEHHNSLLVQLFDPIVSPRCYGLIAVKDC